MAFKRFNGKKIFAVISFFFMFLGILNFAAAENGDGGNIASFLDKIPTNEIVNRVTNFLGFGETWKQIVISLVVFLIIFAGLKDLVAFAPLFRKSTATVIAFGLAIIAILIGLVRSMAVLLLSFAAVLGTLGIIVEIIVAIVIFIGLSIANDKIAEWAVKKYGHAAKIQALRGSYETASAIKGLRKVQREGFESGGRGAGI
jgi:hypothetical protein